MGSGGSVIIFLIIVAFSTLSWVYRKLQEQKARKAAQDAIERQREEMLRTGRVADDAPSAPAMAPVSGQTLAERQARLRELRRQQAQAQAQAGGALGSGQVTASPTGAQPPRPTSNVPPGMREVELWPGGPRILVPLPAGPGAGGGGTQGQSGASRRTATPVAPTAQPARPRQQQRPKRPAQPTPSPQPQTMREQAASEQAAELATLTRRQALASAASAAANAPAEAAKAAREGRAVTSERSSAAATLASTLVPRNTAEWRRAIVLNEVLGKPLSERAGHLA